MKKKFEVGDRVSVMLDDGEWFKPCLIQKVMLHGNLCIDARQSRSIATGHKCPILYPVVHPKQCRRLVKKKKPALPEPPKKKKVWGGERMMIFKERHTYRHQDTLDIDIYIVGPAYPTTKGVFVKVMYINRHFIDSLGAKICQGIEKVSINKEDYWKWSEVK